MDPEETKKQALEEASQAVPVHSPAYFVDNVVKEIRQDQKKADLSIAEQERKVLMDGSSSEFWTILKKKMLNTIDVMRKAESTRMGTGNLDLQAIGMRSIVINEIADAFLDVIRNVEQPYRKQIVTDLSDQEDLPETVGLEEEKDQG